MPVVSTSVTTHLSPAEVLRILTDFGPARGRKPFRGVDDSNLTLHDSGDSWADVTEGNKIGWERERYDWDAGGGHHFRGDHRVQPVGSGQPVGLHAHPAGRPAPWSRSVWNGTPRDFWVISSAHWCRSVASG